MKKEQKIDYKAKFENLHAEYKKLQELLLVNQNFADKMKKENEELKKENKWLKKEQNLLKCKIAYESLCFYESYTFALGIIECYEQMEQKAKEFKSSLNEKDSQNA